MQPEIFQGRGGFVEIVHFDKPFHQKHKEIRCHRQEKIEIFLLATFKTTF